MLGPIHWVSVVMICDSTLVHGCLIFLFFTFSFFLFFSFFHILEEHTYVCMRTFSLILRIPNIICRDCSVNISDLRGGQRHDKWLTLQNIKMGRLHLAVTVLEDDGKVHDFCKFKTIHFKEF